MELTKEFIQHKLDTDDHWLARGILAIYRKQTLDEQRTEQTLHHNNVGFNGADANFLSSLASWLLAGRTLSAKQAYVARKRMKKYAGQLLKIAQERRAA